MNKNFLSKMLILDNI